MTDKVPQKSVKFKKYIFATLQFIAQKCLTVIVLLTLLLAVIYGRILWKPIDLTFLEPYLEQQFTDTPYAIDLQGTHIMSDRQVELVGIKINKVILNHRQNDTKHILHHVLLDISKKSLAQGALGLNKILIDHIDSESINSTNNDKEIKTELAKTLSIYQTLNDYLNIPLMRSLQTMVIKKSNLKFNIPFATDDQTRDQAIDQTSDKTSDFEIYGKTLSFNRVHNHLALKLETDIQSDVMGIKALPATLDISYALQEHDNFDMTFTLGSKQLQNHFLKHHFSGKVFLKATASLNDNMSFKKFNASLYLNNVLVPISVNNPNEIFKIKQGVLNLGYDPKTPAFNFNIEHLKTNRGTLKGSASLTSKGNFKADIALENFYDGLIYKTPIGAKNIHINGHYDDLKHQLDIKKFDINFIQKTRITGKAQLKFNKNIAYDFQTGIQHLTIKHLFQLWPHNAAQGARQWASQNLKSAQFETAHFKASGFAHQDYPRKMSLNAPITQGVVSYLEPMKYATDVTGALVIDNEKFAAQISAAKIGNLKISKASFTIPDITQPVPHGYIKANIAGRLKEGLTLINTKPLRLMTKGGFGYQQATGSFKGLLKLDFALLKEVKLDAIKMQSDVTVKNGSLKVGAKQIPLQNIDARLFVTANKAKGSGKVTLYGLRSSFDWSENFNKRASVTTDVRMKTFLNDRQIIAALPFLIDSTIPFQDYLKGSAYLKTHLQLQRASIKKLDVYGNLTKMRLGWAHSIWQLPAGEKKILKLLGFDRDHDFQIQKITFNHKDLQTYIRDMNIGKNGIKSAQINNLTFKNILQSAHGHYHIAKQKHFVKLRAHNASFIPIIEFEKKNKVLSVVKKIKIYPNITASLYANTLTLYKDVIVDKANLVATADSKNQHDISMTINAPKMKMTHIKVQELAPHKRKITITAKNAGNLITQLGLFEAFKGGNLTIDIMQKVHSLRGSLSITDGTILKAPLITKLLSFASLSGISDRLNNRGLSVDKVEFNFTKDHDFVKFKNGLIHGSAVGMSFQGDYHAQFETLNMYGTLVPFYGLNSILSNIPIIGKITSSRKGEGIVGLSYQIKGKIDQPNITIDPLSFLSIGIIRRIFE
ncbi:MAG: hypothetical protein ACJARD_001059 [Alphaproteobacteria bacterium]|jgi:hypothetical protein